MRLLEVLAALGLATRDGANWSGVELARGLGARERFVRADARNALLQAGDLAARAARGGFTPGWSHADPLILETQGTMSAAIVERLVRSVFPSLDGLPERLASPGADFLDVGTGVGEIGIGLCDHFAHLRVVGLEPSAAPRALALAKIAAAGLAGRASSCATSESRSSSTSPQFDLAWMALPFLPPALAGAAINAVHRALRPGGWLLVATLGSPAGGDLGDALAAFRSVLWGGGPLAPDAVEKRPRRRRVHRASRRSHARPRGSPPLVARRPWARAQPRIRPSTSSRLASMCARETRLSRHRRSSGSVLDERTLKCQSVVVDREAVELGDVARRVARADRLHPRRAGRRPRS